jgi:hypothetical protein
MVSMRHIVWFAGLLMAGAGLSAWADSDSPGSEITLRYQAYVAGAPVGEATVTVTVVDDHYQVVGDARSNGLLRGFSQWRNRFAAHGRLHDAGPQPITFNYSERDSRKTRDVAVREGVLEQTKNGRQRPQREAPSGSDVVSALFVAPRCEDDHQLHTGRYAYMLTRLDAGPGSCRYLVTDDDDDSFEIELEFGDHGGLVVPQSITVYAWLTGRVELVGVG